MWTKVCGSLSLAHPVG